MISPPFRIKVCGIRESEHAEVVAASGGDAIGLNFYPPSARYLPPPQARRVVQVAVASGVLPIGVFVDCPLEDILHTAELAGLRLVQLHGDETLELADYLVAQGLGVIRAVRLPTGPLEPRTISAAIDPWVRAGCSILLDADAGAAFGGCGVRLDWASLRRWQGQSELPIPFALAGGLTTDSVAPAVSASNAWSVDVASGVEASRGEKSPEMIRHFVAQARAALGLDQS